MHSLVIPVFKNESSIRALLDAVDSINGRLDARLEVVFVVDGSPDRSFELLREALPKAGYQSQLINLSRNFGSFAAVRCGLRHARGDRFAVMAADLQEPPELIIGIFESLLRDEADVVIGARDGRKDPLGSKIASAIFWTLYKFLIQPEMPKGGVDIFGCSQMVREQLLSIEEGHSSLIGLLFWLGFRRKQIGYVRNPRHSGASSWTLRKKIAYLSDSIFAFSNLPIRALTLIGAFSITLSTFLGSAVLYAKFTNQVPVPGYTATLLAIMFFGGINTLGLGIIGSYTWRTFENTQRRPLSIPMVHFSFKGRPSDAT